MAVRPQKSNVVKKGMSIFAKKVHDDYLWSAPAGEPCRQSSKRVKVLETLQGRFEFSEDPPGKRVIDIQID